MCHSATRHKHAHKPRTCTRVAVLVSALGRARVDRNFPFIPTPCRPLRYFASDGVYPVPVDSENTPSEDLGAWRESSLMWLRGWEVLLVLRDVEWYYSTIVYLRFRPGHPLSSLPSFLLLSYRSTSSPPLIVPTPQIIPSCAALFCVRTFLLALKLVWGMRKHHPSYSRGCGEFVHAFLSLVQRRHHARNCFDDCWQARVRLYLHAITPAVVP